MFSQRVLEERYPIDATIYNKIYYGDSLVVASTGDTLRVWNLRGDFTRWRRSRLAFITCVALKGFRIAAGIEDGSVYILYCDMKKRKIKVLTKLESPYKSPIDQIRFLDTEDAITRCMFFQPNKVFFNKMLPEAIDVPGKMFYHLDAIQTTNDPSKYLLFGTGEKKKAISVRLVDRNGFGEQKPPIWDSAKWRSLHPQMPQIEETEILDISSDGWLLLAEDTCKSDTRRVRLINVYSKSTYLADPGFMCGCLLSTTRAEASFVVQGIMPSALRAYNWNAEKQEHTLLQTWGTEAPDRSPIQKKVAGYNGNFVIVWDHKWNDKCAALLFCRLQPGSESDEIIESACTYPQPYRPSWLQPGSESDEIIESAYWRDDSGALLVRKTKSYHVRRWTFDGNIFRLTERLPLVRSNGKVKYTRIAMHENVIAVCSEVIRKSVTVQLWRSNENPETFKIRTVESGIIKLISFHTEQFCLITEKELIVFDKSSSQRLNINHVKNACSDPKSHQLKVLTDETLEIYDTNLQLEESYKHWKIHDEQTAMNSSSLNWVTFDDDQSRFQYFRKGEELRVFDLENTVSLNLLSGKNVIITRDSSVNCFSLHDDEGLIWNLSCPTVPLDWQVKESNGRYFLLTKHTFSVIEPDQDVYKERILFGFKERAASEVILASGEWSILYHVGNGNTMSRVLRGREVNFNS